VGGRELVRARVLASAFVCVAAWNRGLANGAWAAREERKLMM
jgi:hypothetical protein